MSEDDLVRRLQVGHDSGCAMSYGMHEHCCDCSYVDRQDAADAITRLQARVAELEAENKQRQEIIENHRTARNTLEADLAAARALLRRWMDPDEPNILVHELIEATSAALYGEDAP